MKKLFMLFAITIIGSLSVFAEIKSFIYNTTVDDETVYFAVYYDTEGLTTYNTEFGMLVKYYTESDVLDIGNMRPEIYTNGFTYMFDGFVDGNFESKFSLDEDKTGLGVDFIRICCNLLKKYGYFRMDVYSDPTRKGVIEFFLVGDDKIMERRWVATEDNAKNKKKGTKK